MKYYEIILLLFFVSVTSLIFNSCSDSPTEYSSEKVITIKSSDHTVWEIYGDSADFILNTGVPNKTGADLKVYLEVSGNAIIGSDCDSIISNGCVTIPPNEQYARIVVKGVKQDSILEETESVTLRIKECSNKDYGIGLPYQANIIVMDGDGPIVTDIDGNVYHTVLIGSQTWMVENLKTSRFRNGDVVTNSWFYNNNPGNGYIYGRLYDWYAVSDSRKLAPLGWHIPTYAEFAALESAVNGSGNALKSVGQGTGSGAGTNTSGFSALLAGYRHLGGSFGSLGYNTNFWSSTAVGSSGGVGLYLLDDNSVIYMNGSTKGYGYSIRCVKDE